MTQAYPSYRVEASRNTIPTISMPVCSVNAAKPPDYNVQIVVESQYYISGWTVLGGVFSNSLAIFPCGFTCLMAISCIIAAA